MLANGRYIIRDMVAKGRYIIREMLANRRYVIREIVANGRYIIREIEPTVVLRLYQFFCGAYTCNHKGIVSLLV